MHILHTGTFTPARAGTLNVFGFFTEDCCDYFTHTESSGSFSGWDGPDGLDVGAGDSLKFIADSSGHRAGFKICYSPSSNGGGVFISGGTVTMTNTNVTDNLGILSGGGIFNDGGVLTLNGGTITGNTATFGLAVGMESGSFSATGLTTDVAAPWGYLFEGGSAEGAQCQSPCVAGEFGSCSVASGTTLCFVNCECYKCPAGKVSSVVGATSDTCTFCGAGEVSAAGDTACSACLAGKYATDDPTDTGGGLDSQISLGATSCNDCPAGYLAAAGSSIVCAACDAGKYSGTGATVCPDCAAGTYSSSAYATCTVCIAGFKTSLASAATACLACDAGYTSDAGSVNCVACLAGKFSPSGAASCTDCAPGSFNDAPGLGVCSDCPGNTYSDAGSSECLLCLRYYYYSLQGECVDCPAGTSCEVDGGSTQVNLIVNPGFWRISATAVVIYECPLIIGCVGNAAFEDEGNGYCDEGYTGPLCAVCDPETHYFSPDDKACLACASGDTGNLMSPTLLIVGGVMLLGLIATVLFALKTCTASGAQDDPKAKAKAMSKAAQKRKEDYEDLVKTMRGRSDQVKMTPDGKITFIRVEAPKQSLKTSTDATEITTPIANITITKNEVTVTVEEKRTTALVTKSNAALSAGSAMANMQVKLKMMTSFGQIAVNIPFNCNVGFPEQFTKMLDSLAVVNFNVVPSLGLNCNFNGFDYISTMVSQTMVPILVSLVMGIVLVLLLIKSCIDSRIPAKQRRLMDAYEAPEELLADFKPEEVEGFRKVFFKYDADGSGSIDRQELGMIVKEFDKSATEEQVDRIFAEANPDGDLTITFAEFLATMKAAKGADGEGSSEFASLGDKVAASMRNEQAQLVISLFLTLTYLVLISCSTSLLHYFKCHEFPEADPPQSYLYKDYSVDCNGARYKAYLLYAQIMILIYPVGIPFLYWSLLYSKRAILSDQLAVDEESRKGFPRIGHLKFLFLSYNADAYYFEAVECGRRLVLASAIGVLSSDSAINPVAGLIVCLAFNYVFTRIKPFDGRKNNTLGVILSYSLTLFFLAAIMLKVRLRVCVRATCAREIERQTVI